MKINFTILCVMIIFTSCSPYPPLKGSISFRSISILTNTRGIYIFNPNAHSIEEMQRITPVEIDAGNYAWSADGKSLIFNCQKRDEWTGICKIDKDGKNFTILISDIEFGGYMFIYNPMAISPNGKSIVFTEFSSVKPYKSDLYRLDIETGDIEIIFHIDSGIELISWSPDGNKIALSTSDYEILFLDSNTLDLLFSASDYYGVWTLDGRYLALSFSHPYHYLYSVNDGKIEGVLDLKDNCIPIDGLAISNTGEHILFINACGESDPNFGLYIADFKSGKIKRIDRMNRNPSPNPEPIVSPAWIPQN